ncbi:MAG TPA: hypothetical protein VM243_14175 [Phycisphaerae bacterium]|nr:hypothetical protein [Phycisphaerae bacterium]
MICKDGEVYSNACYAHAACAKGCKSLGDGPIPADRGDCPRDILCPDYWDPVICKDGEVYSNACYAHAACAKGCKSLGDGPIPTDE